MRDRLTHECFGVDLGLVWTVVERELPLLHTAVADLIVRLGSPSSEDR